MSAQPHLDREEAIASEAVRIATRLLQREPETVIDALVNGPRGLEWERLTRDLARTAVRERDDARGGIANRIAELLWQTAREMGRVRAEGEWR